MSWSCGFVTYVHVSTKFIFEDEYFNSPPQVGGGVNTPNLDGNGLICGKGATLVNTFAICDRVGR